jgi:hypothetical protein
MGLRQRSTYWLAVNLATVIHIILHFAVILIISLIAVFVVGGELSIKPTDSFVNTFLGSIKDVPSEVVFFTYAFLIPLLASSALAALEVCALFYLGLLKSFLCVTVLLVVSAFFTSNLLLGNHLMLLRSDYFVSPGVDIRVGAAIMAGSMILCHIAGRLKIKKWDYLHE